MSLKCQHSLPHSSSSPSFFSFFPTVTCEHTHWINLLRLDWRPAGLLLTKASPNMVSYWEIMLSCHSIWNGDPLCQSWSLAVVTAGPPSLPRWPDAACSRCHHRSDECIPMSPGLSYFDQYQWPPKRNIHVNRRNFSLNLVPEMRAHRTNWLIGKKAADTVKPLAETVKEKGASAYMCVVGGLVKQRRRDFLCPFMPGHFHMSPCSPTHPSHFTLSKTAVWGWCIFTVHQSIKLHQIQ